MSQEIEFQHISKPREGKMPYRRILWAGMRQSEPTLVDKLNIRSTKTIQQEILSEGLYPCLIVWENESKERKYAEVNKNSVKNDRGKLSED